MSTIERTRGGEMILGSQRQTGRSASYWLPLLLVTVPVLSIGCSGGTSSSPYNLVPTTGQVLLDGAPVAGVTLSFVPQRQSTGQGGFAVTDALGKFSAREYTSEKGIAPGIYAVCFSKLALSDGSPIPEGKDAADVGAVEVLPPHLTNAMLNDDEYLVTINVAGNDFLFDLRTHDEEALADVDHAGLTP